jgi:hypothetical protein
MATNGSRLKRRSKRRGAAGCEGAAFGVGAVIGAKGVLMRFVFCIITSAMVVGLLIGCNQADDHEEAERPSTMPASSNPSLSTTTIAVGMKMSDVKTRIEFAGGQPCITSRLIHAFPYDPAGKHTPELFVLKGNIFVRTVSAGLVVTPSSEHTLSSIEILKLKSYGPRTEGLKWIKQHMVEMADEVTLSKEGLVAFKPYGEAKNRRASELQAFSPSDVK